MSKPSRIYRHVPPSPSLVASLTIAEAYLSGEKELGQAVYRLVKRGSFGHLLAGEITLEEASKSSPSLVSSHLNNAKRHYKNASSNHVLKQEVGSEHTPGIRARALLRLPQLPIYDAIYRQGELPNQERAASVYRKLIDGAEGMIDAQQERGRDKSRTVTDLTGIMGETAVLLLAQRYALREIGAESWFPATSLYSEDKGLSADCAGTLPWDVSIFTRISRKDPIDKSYRIQVKNGVDELQSTDDVAVVHVYPDLALREDENRTSALIIRSCMLEFRNPENCERITRDLDARTGQLLDIVD